MKKKAIICLLVTFFTLHASLFTSSAQTLNVKVGNVIYQFPAAKTGEMIYQNGTMLTVMGKTFTLSDISAMTVDNTKVTDGAVSVVYDGTSAKVTVAGNIAQYVTPTVSGAHVSIEQGSDLAEEITYTLSGTSSDGEFYTSGSYKATIELNGLTLTNATPVYSGAAVHVQNSKRIKVKVITGTTNTLVDAGSGSQKSCLYIKGHAEFAQKGTLNIKGNVKHGIKTGEYMTLKNAVINVTSAVGDGISCNEYFLMESGEVNISGIGDDGLQCELDGTTSTGETTDHEDEDSGNIYIEGGTLTVVNSAAGGKGIKADGELHISDGTIDIKVTGSNIKSGNDTTAAKAIKSDGNMTISGGSVAATASSHEAIETKGMLTITDGTVYAYSASDDAINSASHMYLKGGTVTGVSNGNDGIDSNGDMYISGGTVMACGAREPECGLDAAERYHLYITGGTVLGIGGGNNTVTSTTGSQCVLSTSGSVTAGSTVTVKSVSETLASFTVPTAYSPSSSGGGGGWGGPGGGWGGPGGGGPGGGSSSFSYLMSCPGLTAGTSYTITIGSSSSTAKASTSYSGR